ncbi:Palmitoyltransferase PFA4 [Madurella mycetomatis]|uniref:Palmitoyltransferase n=1 Tax=Madurella mycetomatis TaxID=100816 RepID=A0A175W8Q9_9PEZI|nr:Palmitoyltransferase PFA4 [Madurella mycetomatis]
MTSVKTGPSTPGLHILYIPAVCLLIAFQGYFSQYLFNTNPNLAPGPLTRRQTLTFNVLLACLWWTYYLACTVDPGRYIFPAPSSDKADPDLRPTSTSTTPAAPPNHPEKRQPATRWCKKCASPKPPRAHHCRHCRRCIPKMDHHCPWTGNCVSMQTFPYFMRFLVYTNLALWYLAYLLLQRVRAVWAERHLPAYLGPSLPALVGLTLLVLLDGATMVALGILLYTTVKGWVFNATMIEEWEVERHEAVLGRILARDEDSEGEGAGTSGGMTTSR